MRRVKRGRFGLFDAVEKARVSDRCLSKRIDVAGGTSLLPAGSSLCFCRVVEHWTGSCLVGTFLAAELVEIAADICACKAKGGSKGGGCAAFCSGLGKLLIDNLNALHMSPYCFER